MIALQVLLVAATAGAALTVFVLQRAGKLSPASLNVLTVVAALGLTTMIVTDWPTSVASGFWGQHNVLADILSAVLLGGTIYLAFEARESQRQEEIGASLAATGFGGVVDHLVDLDLALTYIASDVPPPVSTWSDPQKPLRWMRDPRVVEHRMDAAIRREPAALDLGPKIKAEDRARAEALVDQSLRRLMAAMRDWAPLFTSGREGRAVLVRLGRLRSALLRLGASLGQPEAQLLWQSLRVECHTLALGLELASGSPQIRPEVRLELPKELPESQEFECYREAAFGLAARGLEARDLSAIRRRLGGSNTRGCP